MRSMKNLKASLVLLLILSVPSVSIASPGKYVSLEKGKPVPWKAWCFDQVAAANIVAEKELSDKKCKLKIGKEKELQQAQFNLEIGKLRAEMEYEVSTRQATIESLKSENLKLEKIIVDSSNPDAITMVTIGIAIGTLTTAVIMGLVL